MHKFTSMDRNALKMILALLLVSIRFLASSQTIHLIPGPVSGSYDGYPVIFNNKLYIQFAQDFNNTHTFTGFQLAEYTDTSYRLYANPDPVSIFPYGYGYSGAPVLYNGNLYFQYVDANLNGQLGRFDGQAVTKIPNLLGFQYTLSIYPWYPYVSNNQLFISYSNNNGIYLAAFDGNQYQLPDTIKGDSYIGFPVSFNGELYVNHFTPDSGYRLNKYISPSLMPVNWEPYYDHQYDGLPFIYHNALYGTYHSLLTNERFWGKYDGSQFTMISIPSLTQDQPIFYGDKVYFLYHAENSVQLVGYDGNSFTPVSNPDASGDDITYPVLYNNKLYFVYTDATHVERLAQFDGSAFTFVPNTEIPAGFTAGFADAIVYNNILYFSYRNTSTLVSQLASFDGVSIHLIANPDSGEGYDGKAIIYNNKLYFGYIPDGSIQTELAYLDNGILPVSLLSFTAQLQKTDALLNWQTATGTNTAYFNILRSSDGIHFSMVHTVKAAAGGSSASQYTYTDAGITSLGISKLYYRLQEMDRDGTSIYSSVKTVDLSGLHPVFSVSPNPAKDFISIASSATISGAQIAITTLNGRVLFITKQNISAAQPLKVSLSQFPKQVLVIIITMHDKREQFKIIKE